MLRALILIVTVIGFTGSTAQAQQAASPVPQGRIVALNGRVEHTPAQQEQWKSRAAGAAALHGRTGS
jgi:hypothetical protein